MELTKATENMTFTINYADGTKREIKEGVLFSFNKENIETHIGTHNAQAVAALVPASVEVVQALGIAHLAENQLVVLSEEKEVKENV